MEASFGRAGGWGGAEEKEGQREGGRQGNTSVGRLFSTRRSGRHSSFPSAPRVPCPSPVSLPSPKPRPPSHRNTLSSMNRAHHTIHTYIHVPVRPLLHRQWRQEAVSSQLPLHPLVPQPYIDRWLRVCGGFVASTLSTSLIHLFVYEIT